MTRRLLWKKGEGFHGHRHKYDHPFKVIEGEVAVCHGGFTRILGPGESVTHMAAHELRAWTLSDGAIVEVDHCHAQSISS